MKIKVSEATGVQLDWLVAKCLGQEYEWMAAFKSCRGKFNYSTDPAQGQPILEREGIDVVRVRVAEPAWSGSNLSIQQFGPTMLIAGLRCFVASKLGDEVEVPNEIA